MTADRARLAAQQAAVLATLAGEEAAPPGFDAARLAVQAAALVRRRPAPVTDSAPQRPAPVVRSGMPAFSRRVRLVLLVPATVACLLLLLPWATYDGGSPRAWDVTTPWLVAGPLSLAALVLLVLPARPTGHADLLAVVAACLAAALGVAGLLHVHGAGDGGPGFDTQTISAVGVPTATAFFTASSSSSLPRDSVRTALGAELTGAARAGLAVELLLAGGALAALRRSTRQG